MKELLKSENELAKIIKENSKSEILVKNEKYVVYDRKWYTLWLAKMMKISEKKLILH